MKKEIILEQLTLKNFKGVFDQAFHLNGSTNIYGANESGKSTFLTAFLWLLTGKDEFDRLDYEIKNTKKPELNRQGHEVEGVFRINDQRITFKRIYWEKWQRPRQTTQEVFKGHETEFYVNDVPCPTATEFKAKVDEMIPANVLKMITNPHYFNSLDWKDQRRGLISIAGEVSDKDVFDSIVTPDRDFATLIMALNTGKKIDGYKDEIGAKILKLKKASAEYAPRIDEVKRGKPEAKDWPAIEDSIAQKAVEIEKIDNIISDALKAFQEKQKRISEQRNVLFRQQSALADIRNKTRLKIEQERSEGPNKIAGLKKQASTVNSEIVRIEKEIANKKANVSSYQQELTRLDQLIAGHREAWNLINSEKFEFDETKCECPTCKQALPADQVAEKRETLLKNFNKSVADRKADEVRKSDQRKAERKQAEGNIDLAAQSILNLENQLAEQVSKQADINAEIDRLTSQQPQDELHIEAATDNAVASDAEYTKLQSEIAALDTEIKAATEALGQPDDHSEEKEKIRALRQEIDELKKDLALKRVIEDADKRIQQLDDEWKATAQEIASLEQQQFDIDTYTRAKMDIVEKRVNGMFKYVRFRLFDTQVNGQVVESCVCEYKGVPYPTLNTAAKLLAGIDVLNTLSDYYGVYAPVICDNRESVTYIPESKSQIISLFVSPGDKTLRVEPASAMKKAS